MEAASSSEEHDDSEGSTTVVGNSSGSENNVSNINEEEVNVAFDEYYNVQVREVEVQTETFCEEAVPASLSHDGFDSSLLGFEYIHMQALNNIAACKHHVLDILGGVENDKNDEGENAELIGSGSARSSGDSGAHDCGLALDLTDFDDMKAMANAREVVGRAHWVKCDTSYSTYDSKGCIEHLDDWSDPKFLAATAVIHGSAHLFFLEYASNASVDAVSMFVHNYIVRHISGFSFALAVEDAHEDQLMSECGPEPVEFNVIPLISHNGCLHPVGEPCCCETFSDQESEGDLGNFEHDLSVK
jgi:hypothetical protein